jgi:hypothetical protein
MTVIRSRRINLWPGLHTVVHMITPRLLGMQCMHMPRRLRMVHTPARICSGMLRRLRDRQALSRMRKMSILPLRWRTQTRLSSGRLRWLKALCSSSSLLDAAGLGLARCEPYR